MKLFTKSLIMLTAVVLLAASCKQSTQKSDSSTEKDMVEKAEIEAGLKDIANPLPEPFEVYNMLEGIGASYLGSVLNPLDNAEKYFSQKSKAVNVGVYTADLGYSAIYDKKDEAKAYSIVLKSLVEDLGVTIDYSVMLTDESKNILADKDSLIAFVSGVYYDTYNFLYKESAPELSALMAAGAWTEGLYIATHISEDTYQNTEIIKIIYDQSESLEALIGFLAKYPEDEMVSTLHDAFVKLKALYDVTDGNLSKEDLEKITSTIETIRDSLIS